jgi:hypothetical protein
MRKQNQSFGLNSSKFENEETVERSQAELRHQGQFPLDIHVLPGTLLYASLSLLTALTLKFKQEPRHRSLCRNYVTMTRISAA